MPELRKNMSDILADRIEETKTRIAEIETDLAQIPNERKKLLGAAQIEQGALSSLDEQETKFKREREYLRQRLPLLEEQQEQAFAGDAQRRISVEMTAEAHGLRDRSLLLDEEFNSNVAATLETARQIARTNRQYKSLEQEQGYYQDRFPDGIERVFFASIASLPQHGKFIKELAEILEPLRNPDNQDLWLQRRRTLKAEGPRRGQV